MYFLFTMRCYHDILKIGDNMLKRKIENELLNWKNAENDKILFLKGPRFVGKSFSVKEFVKANYDYVMYIDFEESPLLKSIFMGSLTISNLLKQMNLKLPPHKLLEGKTVLVLDEVHLCPNARKAAHILKEEKNIDVILISSFAEANYEKFDPTLSNLEIELYMHSLDLEEFLWANGISEERISLVKDHFNKKLEIPNAIHEQLIESFKEYMIVGGMPEVVSEFVNKHDYRRVGRLQLHRLNQIKKDAKKFLSKPMYNKVILSYESLYEQLIKEYKKFQYGVVEDKGNARKFESSVLWLYDTNYINISFEINSLSYPFSNIARYDIFKVYYRDVGFLSSQMSIEDKQNLLDGDFNILNDAILEQTMADLLAKRGYRLYYYMRGTSLAMEFMIHYDNEITALSVNNADNTKSKAMESLMDNHNLKSGIALSKNNIQVTDKLITYPLYCVMFL